MKKYSLIIFLLLYLFNYKIFAEKFSLESPAFQLNSMIPTQYTCNGADQSPPLIWHNAPAKTQSFALVMEDPGAPNGAWTHWVLFNIPANVTHLDAGSPTPEGATSGQNSWGGLGYRGPCPPIGTHTYVFKFYALDKIINIQSGAAKDSVLDALTGHVIGSAQWVGLYEKTTHN